MENHKWTKPVCGGEIIGGHEAIPHSRPYMAFLWISVQNSESWFGDNFPFKTKTCGGFLIREDFVLTAAHCNGRAIWVTLGAHDISKQEWTQHVIPVKRAIPHPDYNDKTFANDIMLLQLHRKATLNPYVQTIRLPRKNHSVMPGKVCTVAGWGRLGVNAQTADKLQEVDLEVQNKDACLHLYILPFNNTLQICVGDPGTRKDSFMGDSGGPLVCHKVAEGINSFGKGDGTPPLVYTRISSYVPWIEKTMSQFKLQGPGGSARD
ncbi:PREDICTED: mast cell protease 3-like [Condylura cristata]|uniref:mast cell protease 3-like n=1 Tax=Condylura cristata TaxID=143302 RepID=UPI000642DD9B|nr:PREDICTED: mast cell protease 3-like [Condylura cristata]